jgi:SAM-dependent methyltransferase
MADESLSRRALFRLQFVPRATPKPDFEAYKDAISVRFEAGADALMRAWEPLAPLLCDAAGIEAGARVLDAGTGDGNVALEAARRGAVVTGCDLVPAQLDRARERSDEAGVEVIWSRGDVEALLDWDETYDAVVSSFGMIFAPRPKRTVRELLRILKPGGVLVIAAPTSYSFTAAAIELGERPAGVPSPADWGREDIARERILAVAPGVEVEVLTHRLELSFDGEAWAWAAYSWPLGLTLRERDAFADLVAVHSDSTASVRIEDEVTFVVARR